MKPWKSRLPETACKPVGCLECRNTGYQGRMGIYEMFTMTNEVKKLVTVDCDITALRTQVVKDGLKPMRLSGANKIANGVTTMEEVIRVAPPPID